MYAYIKSRLKYWSLSLCDAPESGWAKICPRSYFLYFKQFRTIFKYYTSSRSKIVNLWWKYVPSLKTLYIVIRCWPRYFEWRRESPTKCPKDFLVLFCKRLKLKVHVSRIQILIFHKGWPNWNVHFFSKTKK